MSGRLRKYRNRMKRIRGYKTKLIQAIASGTDEQVARLVKHKGTNYLKNFIISNHYSISKIQLKNYAKL